MHRAGSTWMRKTAARAPRPSRAPRGHRARHHQRAIQRFAARRERKTPPVSQATAKLRGRWPSPAVTAESAGRRPEPNERVTSEIGVQEADRERPGERGDQQPGEQQVLQPEVGTPAVHDVVGPAAEPPRHPGSQVVQRADRADPAAERAAEEDGERDGDERRRQPRRQQPRRGEDGRGPRAGRARAAGGRGIEGSPRPSSGASEAKKNSEEEALVHAAEDARQVDGRPGSGDSGLPRERQRPSHSPRPPPPRRLPPRGSRGRGRRPGRRGRPRPGRARPVARPRRRRRRGRCPPPPRSP